MDTNAYRMIFLSSNLWSDPFSGSVVVATSNTSLSNGDDDDDVCFSLSTSAMVICQKWALDDVCVRRKGTFSYNRLYIWLSNLIHVYVVLQKSAKIGHEREI